MKSQTPTWAIIVAILMMLVGGCGIKNDAQSINIRTFLSLKDKIVNKIETKKNRTSKESIDTNLSANIKEETIDSGDVDYAENVVSEDTLKSDSSKSDDEINVKEMVDDMLNIPEETIVSIIRFGYIGLFFSFLFIVGGIFLLIKKKFSLKLAYGVIAANIVFAIIKWTVLSGKGGTLLSIGNSVGAAFTIFIALILFIVIVSCDKSHYEDIYID